MSRWAAPTFRDRLLPVRCKNCVGASTIGWDAKLAKIATTLPIKADDRSASRHASARRDTTTETGRAGDRLGRFRQRNGSSIAGAHRVVRYMRRWAHPRRVESIRLGCFRGLGDSALEDNGDRIRGERVPAHSGQTRSCGRGTPLLIDRTNRSA